MGKQLNVLTGQISHPTSVQLIMHFICCRLKAPGARSGVKVVDALVRHQNITMQDSRVWRCLWTVEDCATKSLTWCLFTCPINFPPLKSCVKKKKKKKDTRSLPALFICRQPPWTKGEGTSDLKCWFTEPKDVRLNKLCYKVWDCCRIVSAGTFNGQLEPFFLYSDCVFGGIEWQQTSTAWEKLNFSKQTWVNSR